MKLVPFLLILCSVCSATKLKRIKNLVVAIGGIASLARGGSGGIGKSLQLASQRFAASGQQYASSYANQPLVISTIISSLDTTTNTLHPITSTNPVSVNTLQPLASNNAVTVHTLQIPAPTSPIAVSSLQPVASTTVVSAQQPQLLTKPGLVNQYTVNTAFPIAAPSAWPVGNPILIPIGQSTPIASSHLVDHAPLLHPVQSAQQPLLVDPLLQSGYVH